MGPEIVGKTFIGPSPIYTETLKTIRNWELGVKDVLKS